MSPPAAHVAVRDEVVQGSSTFSNTVIMFSCSPVGGGSSIDFVLKDFLDSHNSDLCHHFAGHKNDLEEYVMLKIALANLCPKCWS